MESAGSMLHLPFSRDPLPVYLFIYLTKRLRQDDDDDDDDDDNNNNNNND